MIMINENYNYNYNTIMLLLLIALMCLFFQPCFPPYIIVGYSIYFYSCFISSPERFHQAASELHRDINESRKTQNHPSGIKRFTAFDNPGVTMTTGVSVALTRRRP